MINCDDAIDVIIKRLQDGEETRVMRELMSLGILLRDERGEFRSTHDVLQDLYKKWMEVKQ